MPRISGRSVERRDREQDDYVDMHINIWRALYEEDFDEVERQMREEPSDILSYTVSI
jgi:hypothetical protein